MSNSKDSPKVLIIKQFNSILKSIVSKLNYIIRSTESELMVSNISILIRNDPTFILDNNERLWSYRQTLMSIQTDNGYNWEILRTLDLSHEVDLEGNLINDEGNKIIELIRNTILSKMSEEERIEIYEDVINLYREIAKFRIISQE